MPRRYRISLAWIWMSDAVPCVPPEGWCIMMRACGSAARRPLRPAGQQEASHARRHAHAGGVHRRAEELHRVVNREACRDAAAGRVHVQVDVALRVVGIQEEQLRDDDVGDIVVHWGPQEHDAVHEEAGEDVVGALAAAGALDDVRWIQRGHGTLVGQFAVIGHESIGRRCDRRCVAKVIRRCSVPGAT